MPNQKIYITGMDAATGKLTLSDKGKTKVGSKWKFRKITWKIDYSKVKSFKIEGKQSYNPFEESPPTNFDDKVDLTVRKDEPAIEWEYSIHWKDEDGKITVSDPIISISPSYLHDEEE